MDSAAATHVGRVRTVNEDAYLELPGLVLVADGMGGHACGDVASALTVDAFAPLAECAELMPADVTAAVERANRAILAEADLNRDKAGMGTTVAGIAVVSQAGSPHWLVFNVGDSRVYRINGQSAQQMTVDHSEVAELVASGMVSPGDAHTHPLRNVITRSLGTDPAPVPDTWLEPVREGDRFLVCSDGLTNELDDDEIASLVARAPTLHEAVKALVSAAVAAGGRDNVTAVMVEARVRPTTVENSEITLPRETGTHRK